MAAAKAGIASVVFVGTSFVRTASVVASSIGMPDLGIAEYPGAVQVDSEAAIRENMEKVVLDRVIAGLTGPGRSSGVARAGNPEEIVATGGLVEVNKLFHEKGWTDGLAIVPPTLEMIREYLRYTDRSPHEEIAILPQADLRATPWNVAANAIMAGCGPEFMPLLIAAVEAVGEPEFQLMNLGSTGCKTPWLLVNGPIVKQLGIEYGLGLRSRGPNPSIGRALGLILNNIAGLRPGVTLMGSWGYYLPFVLAENEAVCEEIGWEPYHVRYGFDKGTSTVTARTTVYWGGPVTPSTSTPLAPTPRSILKLTSKNLERNTMVESSLRFGNRNMVAVLMTPLAARVVARGGYSKRDVARYLWENTGMTVGEANNCLQAYTGAGVTVHELVELGRLPKSFDLSDNETIPLFADAEMIDVVVCGDEHRDKVMSLWCNYQTPVTKGILGVGGQGPGADTTAP
ncbi:MAG: hypothetical protein HYX92_15135 [Chloroflexi bacterium]|nr:hypothetical protein [Chloroflexota bacterium]